MAPLALVLGACAPCEDCAPESDPPDTDDTEDPVETGPPVDTTSTDTGDACSNGIYQGLLTIVEATVTCDPADRVRYYVDTDGWTANGRVFSQETGQGVAVPQWADEHDVISYEFGSCQFWDHLDQELETGVSVATWNPNVSTVFTCQGHFESSVMTYAVQVDDLDGVPADCLAFGDDPSGLISNTAGDRVNDPSFALSGCSVGVAAR